MAYAQTDNQNRNGLAALADDASAIGKRKRGSSNCGGCGGTAVVAAPAYGGSPCCGSRQ